MRVHAVIEKLQAEIAHNERELDQKRAFLATLLRLSGVPVTEGATARRRPLVPGSVPHRIVEIVGEAKGPVTYDVILEGAKASRHQVKHALKQLVLAGRIKRTGATASTRYQPA